jgi:hypothetical protein
MASSLKVGLDDFVKLRWAGWCATILCLAAAACGTVTDDHSAASSAAGSSMTGGSGGASSGTNSTTGEGGASASSGTGGADDCARPTIALLADKQETVTWIALDATSVYWGDQGPDSNQIRTMPKAGGSVAVLATTQQPPGNLAVDDTHVYWSEDVGVTTTLYSIAKAGGPSAPMQLAMTGTGACSGLSVDADTIYWSAGPWIFSLPKGGAPAPTEFAMPDPVQDIDRRAVLADQDRVYWLEGNNRIVSVPKSGSSPKKVFPLYNSARRFVVGEYAIFLGDPFGTPQDSGNLVAVPKNGGEPTTLVAGNEGVPEIAASSSCVYWTSQKSNRLRAVPKLGGDPLTIAQVGGAGAVIAADESGVYWGERESHKLMRATK